MTTIDTEEKVREIIKATEKAKQKFLEEEIKEFDVFENENGIDFGAIFWNKKNTKKLVVKIIWSKSTKKLFKCIVSSEKHQLVNTIDYNSVIACINNN